MKTSLFVAAALLSINAFAANNTFKFRVFSSGADIFPCNAGIMHAGKQAQNGYIVDTANPNYNGYGSQVVDSVTNTSVDGSYLPDVMSYSVVAYDEWSGVQSISQTGKKFANNDSAAWSAIFSSNNIVDLRDASLIQYNQHKVNDVNNVISGLDFVLSSENYGASYFVDICYYAPKFAPNPTGNQNYSFTSKAGFTNLVTGRDYLNRAQVKTDVVMYCDGQKIVEKKGQQVLSNSEAVFFNKHAFVNSNSASPDKCVVRYVFTETSNARRNHAAHGGEFTLFTDITDPSISE